MISNMVKKKKKIQKYNVTGNSSFTLPRTDIKTLYDRSINFDSV